MICNDCGCRTVCRVFRYVSKTSPIATLDVTECRNHIRNTKVESVMERSVPSFKDLHVPGASSPSVAMYHERLRRPTRSTKELQHDMAMLKALNENDEELQDADTERLCSACDRMAKASHGTECSECGRFVCDECATKTIDHRTLCPSCYDKD